MTERLVARARVLAARDDGWLQVQLLGGEACPGCRCGRLSLPRRRTAELKPTPPISVTEGEEVTVSLPVGAVLRGAARLHGLPWASMVAGAAAAAAAGFGDAGCALGAGLGFAGALLYLRRARAGSLDHGAATVSLAIDP